MCMFCPQVVDSVLAVCPALAEEQQLVTENLELLHRLAATAQQVRRLVLSTPQLLATPIQAWQDFLTAYGLESTQIWRLLVNQPRLLLQGSIVGAGRAIMFLKQLGWSDLEISTLVIQHPQHSTILLVSIGRSSMLHRMFSATRHSATRHRALSLHHVGPVCSVAAAAAVVLWRCRACTGCHAVLSVLAVLSPALPLLSSSCLFCRWM